MILKTRKVRSIRPRKPEKSEARGLCEKPGKSPSVILPVLTFRVSVGLRRCRVLGPSETTPAHRKVNQRVEDRSSAQSECCLTTTFPYKG
jgi:hypothetical protein